MRALAEHGRPDALQWPAGSVLHVLGSELQQKTGALLVEALVERGVVAYPEAHDGRSRIHRGGAADAAERRRPIRRGPGMRPASPPISCTGAR